MSISALRHEHRQILLPWRGAEMLIHRVPTAEQGQEVLLPDGDRERYADRGPQRIASPDPVPHLEPVLGMDAELVHRAVIHRDGREVLPHGLLAAFRSHPGAGRTGIGQRLERRERLRCDDEQGGLRIGVTHLCLGVLGIRLLSEVCRAGPP